MPPDLLLVSDRGTVSLEHIARLHRHGRHMLCAVPWNDYRHLYDANADRLHWQRSAAFCRRSSSVAASPARRCRVSITTWRCGRIAWPIRPREKRSHVVSSSYAVPRPSRRNVQRRQQNIATIRSGLEALAAKLERGHPCTTAASIQRQIARLLGRRGAAALFRWELLPLTADEVQQLPPPRKGFRRPTHRLVYTFDEAAATAAMRYDGLSILLTTAAAAPERRRVVDDLQGAMLCGIDAPSVEDAAVGAAGVSEIAAACGGVGVPAGDGVAGVSDAGAPVPAERAGGRTGGVTTDDDADVAAAFPNVRRRGGTDRAGRVAMQRVRRASKQRFCGNWDFRAWRKPLA